MKKKIIILLTVIIVILGVIAYGYSKAIPPLKNEGQPRPQIIITPKTFDFGNVDFGLVAKYTFKIKNSGNEVLAIQRVATSCACTSAKVSQEKINPGEEAELTVEYDTKLMGSGPHGKGQQERIIYVKSNDPISPQAEVTISAFVN